MQNGYVCIRNTCKILPKICISMDEMAKHKLCEF